MALAMPALAHHSFSAEFDGSKLIELKGVVTRIEWTNPHVYFYLDVKDDKGNTTNWGCEAASPGSLHRQGWNRDSLKVGDQVIVGGYPARDGSKLADAQKSDPARWPQNFWRNSRRWRTRGPKTVVDRAAVIHSRP